MVGSRRAGRGPVAADPSGPRHRSAGGYFPFSRSYFVFHALLRSSMPSMCLIVLQAARARPRIAYIRASLISSSVAPACFAAAKRPGTQDVQPAAAIAASATSCIVLGSRAPSR